MRRKPVCFCVLCILLILSVASCASPDRRRTSRVSGSGGYHTASVTAGSDVSRDDIAMVEEESAQPRMLSVRTSRSARSRARTRRQKTSPPESSATDRTTAESSPTAAQGEKKKRMVMYTGTCRFRVDSVKNAADRAAAIAAEHGGSVRTCNTTGGYSRADITIRVPADAFHTLMDALKNLGTPVSLNISSEDVTAAYRDVMLRAQTLKEILARLHQLLEEAETPEDKVAVLTEIERIEQKLAKMEARAEYYRQRTAFSTITVTLLLRHECGVTRHIPAPFKWIAAAAPHGRYDLSVDDDISADVPDGWFSQRRSYEDRRVPWMYMLPGRAVRVRIGTVENYPRADVDFWKEAVNHDFTARGYDRISSGVVKSGTGPVQVSTWRVSSDAHYLLGFTRSDDGETLLVIEVVYRSGDVLKKQGETVESFIRSVRWE